MRKVETRTVAAVLLATIAAAANVVGGVLLATAVPYLGPLEVLTLPSVGASYAAAAAYVGLVTPRWPALPALLLVALTSPAYALSLGLAQRSGWWVAVGSLVLLQLPSAAWLAVLIARGEGASRLGRAGVALSALVAGTSAVIITLLLDPGTWGWCRCQTNPFALAGDESAYVAFDPWTTVLPSLIATLGVGGAILEIARRPGRLGTAQVALGVGLGATAVGWLLPDTRVVGGGLLVLLGVCLRDVARRRPSRAHVADLLLEAREQGDPRRLEELVARAVGDPGATVWWWLPEAEVYRSATGALTADPGAAGVLSSGDPAGLSGRVLRVESERRPIAIVVSGARELTADASVRDSVAEALRLSTENRRLADELRRSLEQVRASRARIVTAGDEARKRMERDLHDGAQQLLISTGVKLNLASAQVEDSTKSQLAETLADASDDLGRALTELRRLASGITPTALVHGGLRDAVEELALRCPVPVAVSIEGDAEPGATRSITVYFVVAECLANVAKHAHARSAAVILRLEEPLRLQVSDDGHGGADTSAGSGLRGLVDRVEALGGQVEITSDDRGTSVSVVIPGSEQS